MRLALLANDASGAGAASSSVAAALRGHGAEVEVHDVREACAPDGDAAAVVAGRPDRVVVAGGDGSVGGAAELAAALGVPLAVVPTGTANDFARALGLPLDAGAAAALAAREQVRLRSVDLARATAGGSPHPGRSPTGPDAGRPFLNAASAGLSVVAARRAHALKPRLGALAYAVGALRAGLTAHPIRLEVAVDGEPVFAGGAWQVIVAGTGAFGGGSELDVADPADRRLDVAVLAAGPRLALVRRAWGMRAGGLVEQEGVLHARGRHVEVRGAGAFNVDGEVWRAPGAARFELDGRSVRVVVP
jgi:diacylglycerol kinase family enzyme